LFGCGGGLGFPQPPSGVRAGQEEGGGGERHADGKREDGIGQGFNVVGWRELRVNAGQF
jgi:hypothetical protein